MTTQLGRIAGRARRDPKTQFTSLAHLIAVEALKEAWRSLKKGRSAGIDYVLDADISAFFDSMDRKVLMELLRRRVKDRSILRLIAKWLHAGVLEDGVRLYPETGSPQGAVISPLLANVYLHYVLDEWVEEVVRPRMRGEMYLVRYADDAIFCFQYRGDAERVVQALGGRLARFGLRLNPEKTRLIEFGRVAEEQARRRGRRPETFDFLGFTHICGRSRNGEFTVKRKTAAKRLRRSMRRVTEWCRDHRHLPVGEQHKMLCAKLRGHCNYYGLTGNMRSLRKMWWHVVRTWRKWLNRRSQRGRMPWRRFAEVLARYPLPRPTIVYCGYKGAVLA